MTALRQIEESDILVPNRATVLGYMRRYRKLAAMLPDICRRVRAEFPSPFELSFELYKDPEIDDRYLALYVRQAPREEGLYDRIEALRETFPRALDTVSGYFLFTTDFKLPRGKHGV